MTKIKCGFVLLVSALLLCGCGASHGPGGDGGKGGNDGPGGGGGSGGIGGSGGCGGELATSCLEVSRLVPSHGPVGTAVLIEGSGFAERPEDNEVFFNGVAATVSSSPSSGSQLQAIVPAGATTGPVQVRSGEREVVGPDFTVEPPNAIPTLAAISPDAVRMGSRDTEFTVRGTGFCDATRIEVDGSAVPGSVVSSTELTIVIPSDQLAEQRHLEVRAINAPLAAGLPRAFP